MAKKIKDLYSDGLIINYKEGDKAIVRTNFSHRQDINDKSYTISEGDQLTTISYKFYGEPKYWYLIADVNFIDNPFDLVIGTNIIIPNLERYNI